MAMGRPRKYGERGVNKVVLLPLTYASHLEETANDQGISVSDLIYSMISSTNARLAARMAKDFHDLKELLKSREGAMKSQEEKLSEMEKRFSANNTLSFILEDIKKDPKFLEIVEPHAIKVVQEHPAARDLDVLVDLCWDPIERECFVRAKKVSNKKVLRELLLHRIAFHWNEIQGGKKIGRQV